MQNEKKNMQKCKKQVAFFTPEDTNSSFIQTNSLLPCSWKSLSFQPWLIFSSLCLSLVAQGANHFAGDSQYGPVDVDEMVLSYASWEAGLNWSNFLHRLSLVLLYWTEGV